MRRCLVCSSEGVVTPLLGMMALALCPAHHSIVAAAHHAAREEARAKGDPAPILSEDFARRACAQKETR